VKQNSHAVDLSAFTVLALRALHRIKTSSELRELHDEAGTRSQWDSVIDDLQERLKR